MAEKCEVVVVGGGPAGLTAAIALADAGVETVLVCKPAPSDNRTTALLASSVTALDMLGVWARCLPRAAPLRTLRLIDDTSRLLRAPEVRFDAAEIGLDAFGHNIENSHLLAALVARSRELKALRVVEDEATSVELTDDAARIVLPNGEAIAARLIVGSDGRRSICRTSADIAVETWSYPQTALTANLAHSRAHDDTSTEFHTDSGPFTLVPLPGQRCSLVWVARPDRAEQLTELDDAAFAMAVEQRAHSMLGEISCDSDRTIFPLTGQRARRFAANRVVLVGEAAHVLPPIGAQGLNLGLRDAATVAELVVNARRDGADVGADDLVDSYDRTRRPDINSRSLAVDLLNRSLLSDFLPVQSLRGLGLVMLDRIGPLRRAVMREGVAPRAGQPRLMLGEAL